MANITDVIEQHLKRILQQSLNGMVEIQRSDLADRFSCVPSQINYVISTRFTLEKGYIVESKRGGGGYIRIQRVQLPRHDMLQLWARRLADGAISQDQADGVIEQMQDAKLVSSREARILHAAVSREALPFQLPIRDQVRANMLRVLLTALMSKPLESS